MKVEIRRINWEAHPFGLVIDGELVPGQTKVEIISDPMDIPKAVVTFELLPHGSKVKIIDDPPINIK